MTIVKLIPDVDDFIMQVTGMSQALCDMHYILRWTAYDAHRPHDWPSARFLLESYGYSPDASGWKQFVNDRIGQRVTEDWHQYRRMMRRERWCKNCGRLQVWRCGRCATCDTYWKRNHVERPRYLWDIEAVCRNCKFPLSALLPKANGRRRQCRGFCEACSSYRRKYGRERPQHLWGIGPLGWCDCGFPAVALFENMPVCSRHKE